MALFSSKSSALETQTIYKDAHEHNKALQRYERYKRWGIFDTPDLRKTKPATHIHSKPRQGLYAHQNKHGYSR